MDGLGERVLITHSHLFFDSFTNERRDELVIYTGSIIGGLLVDGLGDGVLIDAPYEDLEFIASTSFGLLQVRFNHMCVHVCVAHTCVYRSCVFNMQHLFVVGCALA